MHAKEVRRGLRWMTRNKMLWYTVAVPFNLIVSSLAFPLVAIAHTWRDYSCSILDTATLEGAGYWHEDRG